MISDFFTSSASEVETTPNWLKPLLSTNRCEIRRLVPLLKRFIFFVFCRSKQQEYFNYVYEALTTTSEQTSKADVVQATERRQAVVPTCVAQNSAFVSSITKATLTILRRALLANMWHRCLETTRFVLHLVLTSVTTRLIPRFLSSPSTSLGPWVWHFKSIFMGVAECTRRFISVKVFEYDINCFPFAVHRAPFPWSWKHGMKQTWRPGLQFTNKVRFQSTYYSQRLLLLCKEKTFMAFLNYHLRPDAIVEYGTENVAWWSSRKKSEGMF